MNRVDQYRDERHRAVVAAKTALESGDALLLGKTEVDEETQARADEFYAQAAKARESIAQWDERIQLAQATERAEELVAERAERNKLPKHERGADPEGSKLNDIPTVVELAQRNHAVRSRSAGLPHNADLACKRFEVERLYQTRMREVCLSKPGNEVRLLTEEQREAWETYQGRVRQARTPVELALMPTQKADTDNLGGVLVPEYFEREIHDVAKFIGPLADDSVISVIPTSGMGTVHVPTNTDINDKLPTYTAEAADVGIQTTAWDEVDLTPRNFAVQMVVTDQVLMADHVDMESYLVRKLGINFGRRQNEYFTSGDGANKPKGVTQVKAGQHVQNAAKGTITEADLVGYLKKLDADYRNMPTSFTMFHDDTILDMMVHRTNDVHTFQRTPDGQNIMLPKMPRVRPNNALTALNTGNATNAFLAIGGDFSEYAKVRVGGMRFERQREVRAFQWVLSFNTYMDAGPIIDEAFAVLKSK